MQMLKLEEIKSLKKIQQIKKQALEIYFTRL